VKFATASSTADLPGKAAGREVVLAGDLVTKVGAYLAATYGVPMRCINAKAK
jgi:hypothetical protein